MREVWFLRVITGIYKGRKLWSTEGMDIRPTSDMVKESLFNILGVEVQESDFLDLFGGTGGVGIEAISRGAKHVVFIDNSIKSINVLRKNLQALNIKDSIEVFNTDYRTAINKLYTNGRLFDIVFVDPPYNTGIAQNVLEQISENIILKDNGIIVVEHDLKDPMPDKVGCLNKYRDKRYGSTMLSFYSTREV
jgi:16S rRNA (guanine(966)-N(2))-methyltransferase RsmD